MKQMKIQILQITRTKQKICQMMKSKENWALQKNSMNTVYIKT